MAQIKFFTLTEEWSEFGDIIEDTPQNNKLYYIQNRGNDCFIACEGDSEPENEYGIIVPPRSVVKYEVGDQNLYLKAKSGICAINVSMEG